MAHYTITIKSLIDNHFDFKMDSYPIFDEEYRETLNTKILNHYYMNEIGFETAPLFRFYLNQKLNEIMPYYNELYKVQKKVLEDNLLLSNVNLTETYEGASNTTSNSNSENNVKNLFQDTPQGDISQTEIDNQNWATNLSLNRSNLSDESNSIGNNNYIKKIVGNNGNKFSIDLLNDIKNKLLNIDMLIIDELNELFMQIY